jgi:hypothetical protein
VVPEGREGEVPEEIMDGGRDEGSKDRMGEMEHTQASKIPEVGNSSLDATLI